MRQVVVIVTGMQRAVGVMHCSGMKSFCLYVLFSFFFYSASAEYLIGVGKADVTGPAAQTVAMGYGRAEQVLNGIHTRLWARAFLIGHPTETKHETASPKKYVKICLFRKRVVCVSIEACAASQAVTMGVIEKLKDLYGDLYTETNVAITATHTHAAPGGYLQYFLYSLATTGFVRDTLDAQISGIVEAIQRAHESAELGRVLLSKGELLDASINRSPTAYLNNPEDERRQYLYNTDKEMTQLKLLTTSDREIGLLNWFAVHGTALNNTVTLISGDNKGAASQLFEKHIAQQRNAGGSTNSSKDPFVAAFAQSNSGDVSPNTGGALCIDTGKPCDISTSSCNGRNELCHGRGPGWPDSFKSSYLIAEKQFVKAKELFQQESPELQGDIDARSIFLNMSSLSVTGTNSTGMCRPAMGYSFAAGTTDGPGMFDFVQGSLTRSVFWDFVSSILQRASEVQRNCHDPKPILLDTGEIPNPMPWQPEILQLQILRIGQLVIVCVPAELTTMAGRRLQSAVTAAVQEQLGEGVEVVISGLTNGYSSYITTYEEYQIQRYEGASTIFGPHTLEAYIKEFVNLANDMVHGTHRSSALQPPNYLDRQWSFSLPVILDSVPLTLHFGDVSSDRQKDCYTSGETVEVEFWSANPRNSLWSPGHSFLAVERYIDEATGWISIATDDDLATRFSWRPCLGVRALPCSKSTISWTIGEETMEGLYRIRHSGHAKQSALSPDLDAFHGYSSRFAVQQHCVEAGVQRVEV